MAVEKGTKVGLNIWSWYQPGYAEFLVAKEQESSQSESHDKKEL
jgi:hypothetical protein